MENIEAYKRKLSAIGEAIRTKTGKTDLLDLDEMATEIEGIGGGLKHEVGSFMLDSDTNAVSAKVVNHNLQTKPKIIIVWTDDFAKMEENTYSTNTSFGFIWLEAIGGLPQRLASTVTNDNPLFIGLTMGIGDKRVAVFVPTSKSYCLYEIGIAEDHFRLPTYGNSTYWRAGVEYKYFVSEGFW